MKASQAGAAKLAAPVSLALCLISSSVVGSGMVSADRGTAESPLPALVKSALAQAQQLTGLGRQQLRVLDAAPVNWPDGAGGCPEPDRLYTQAIVPGFRIRIQAGSRLLNYHATRSSTAPVLCPAERVQPALPASGTAAKAPDRELGQAIGPAPPRTDPKLFV